ncbi:hypothetical protein M9H77_30829 [Catharanthus roseus]|uniref:Uncharacterized protein n=1 Tax=Catharanthus roseus TaxID=4058 RepID=A0ACC0A106_CATRO|nr:hypothetical protein M9H77_30829 [Catharanthus roseus]
MLTFSHGCKVVLFQCEWYNTSSTSTMKCDRFFESIDVRSRWYQEGPFVLPNQVQQVFYIPDMLLRANWPIVHPVKHRHLWNLRQLDVNFEILAHNNNRVHVLDDAFQKYKSGEFPLVGEDDRLRTQLRVVVDMEDNIESRAEMTMMKKMKCFFNLLMLKRILGWT